MLGAQEIPAWLDRLARVLPEEVMEPGKWDAPLTRAAFIGTIRNELLPYITCGPHARRSVDDHLSRAITDFRRGWGEEALYWLGEACSAAAR